MENIDHKTHLNQKLNCRAYTQIHLWNPDKYTPGNQLSVSYRGKPIHIAQIVSTEKYTLEDLPEYCCYLDTGYSKKETLAMIGKMFPGLQKTSFVGVSLFEVTQRIYPGNAGEQPGPRPTASRLSKGIPVGYSGNPLPLVLTQASDKESIKSLASFVTDAFVHRLVAEQPGEIDIQTRNNQLIIQAIMALNPHVDASHGMIIVGVINMIRSELIRKLETVAIKQTRLFI